MNRNYKRIESAIIYLVENFSNHPSLDDVASVVNLSPFHFQRMFTQWAGVSPKKFVQYLALQKAKISLEHGATLFHASGDAGLSGTGRLHDLFISIEGMTPGEYKKGANSLIINYSVQESLFGDVLLASTPRGVCKISFLSEDQAPEHLLKVEFPEATFRKQSDQHQQAAMNFFTIDQNYLEKVNLHLKGTPFQIKVWEALISIPEGSLRSYSDIAAQIGNPKASRAVGSAIAKNPVAYLIPCHRVIKSTGEFGNYRWGSTRKTAMIGWEAAQVKNLNI